MLYRRSRSSDEELAESDLQDRLDKLEVSGQLLRNIVRLEEQLAQCRQFTPIFPVQSDRSGLTNLVEGSDLMSSPGLRDSPTVSQTGVYDGGLK